MAIFIEAKTPDLQISDSIYPHPQNLKPSGNRIHGNLQIWHSPGLLACLSLNDCFHSQADLYISNSRLSMLRKLEFDAKRNPSLPTIGVELEAKLPSVLDAIKVYDQLSSVANMHNTYVSSPSGISEFRTPFSYYWTTQATLLNQLLRAGFIPSYFSKNNASNTFCLVNQSQLSLHANFAFPPETAHYLNIRGNDQLKAAASQLAVVSGIAFSTPERLVARKTEYAAKLNTDLKQTVPTAKNPNADVDGRLEIRTLGFGNHFSYIQLAILQYLTSALFSYYREFSEIKSDQTLSLAGEWDKLTNAIKLFLEQAILPIDLTLMKYFNLNYEQRKYYSTKPMMEYLALLQPRALNILQDSFRRIYPIVESS